MKLGKYSFGIGDRFGLEGKAQLRAMIEAKKRGVTITPVWNKSFREHKNVKTEPVSVQQEADEAVKSLNWTDDYFIDADHVNMSNIDYFISCSNFFTIDVADYIGKEADEKSVSDFVAKNQHLCRTIQLPLLNKEIEMSADQLTEIAKKYLFAVEQAGEIYRYLRSKKSDDDFVVEISMDETDEPQSPKEMAMILAAIAGEKIPAQTVAPKFIGEFFKGIDYVGDVNRFAEEFELDLAVLEWAKEKFDLPDSLKLSVHSGSDKFSIYKIIRQGIEIFNTGIHVKTAGTTWLEEVIGLAEAGGSGLEIAREIYARALERIDELSAPYATVIRIDREKLPSAVEVEKWDSVTFVETLRHQPDNPKYNPNFRQLIHIAYKIAAEMGETYIQALNEHREVVEKNVTYNILENHLKPLFLE
ncbi:MAG: hypothetical protein GXO74_08995 [Calditrichaeota bacterium]|nr:hypothetical protein [Calditrichota bacterium]